MELSNKKRRIGDNEQTDVDVYVPIDHWKIVADKMKMQRTHEVFEGYTYGRTHSDFLNTMTQLIKRKLPFHVDIFECLDSEELTKLTIPTTKHKSVHILDAAIKYDDEELVDLLLKKVSHRHVKQHMEGNQHQPLIRACKKYVKYIDRLVQWGENVNGNKDTYGQPLNWLIRNQLVTDESPILDFLEKYQSQLINSINKCRFFGYTYLLMAIEWNRPKTVQKLLEMGSNPNMTDMGFNYTTRYGVAGGMSYSPLMLAILQLPHVVPLLLQYGADPCVVVNNDTALIYACYHNEIDIIKYMLDNTNVIETLEIVDVDGYTAINYLDHKIKAVSGECTDPEIIYESIISTKIKEMLLDATYEIHKTPKIHKLLSLLLLLLYSLIISFSF